MGTKVLQLAPLVSYLPCTAFHASPEDVELCESCGWSDEDHEADLAA